jgi:capsular polysaccharide biosynthesis protein
MIKYIFHIEDRGHVFLYHWLFFMIGGLKNIINNKLIKGNDGGGIIEQNIELFNKNNNTPPYYIYFSYIDNNNFLDYQIDTLKIIKDTFIIIDKNKISSNDIIINNYGELTINTIDNLLFLKNLFLSNIDKKLLNNKFNFDYIYIRRDRSHFCVGNKNENYIKRRHILNEEKLCNKLKIYNYDCIYLEEYSLIDKINIFTNAKQIISPNSAALSFIIFCNIECKIIEINTKNPHQIYNQYENITNILNIPYQRYINVNKVDQLDNMNIDIDHFINFITIS